MKVTSVCLGVACGILAGGMLLPAMAQVTSDGTTNTTVNPNGNNFTILNGVEKGSNLFHSFGQFSIPTGGSATFDLINTPNISTIFSRVTGGSVSQIDGLIQTVNSSNPVSLFLLNPSGIIFGQNASLNIGGSFVATTANSIKFADGTEFSATSPLSTPPLLTIAVPIGLQFGSNPQPITVQDTGHSLTAANRQSTTSLQGSTTTGLQVATGRTLALVGGDVQMQGGVLTAPGGRIELGSVAGIGSVGMTTVSDGYALNYDGISSFGDIRLSQRSLADVGGNLAGSIQVQGRNISLSDGSVLLVQNRGTQAAGNIRVNATESLEAKDYSANVRSGLFNDVNNSGAGGGIDITTSRLSLYDGGAISARTYGLGSGGDITIRATNLESRNLVDIGDARGGVINTATLSSAKGGNINIYTERLAISDGSALSANTRSTGQGGNITVNADKIEVAGMSADIQHSTVISTSASSTGLPGNLALNTRTLSIRNSASVGSSGFGVAPAGNITINASEWVEVVGRQPGANRVSQIQSSITNPPPVLQLGTQSENLQGTAGNLIITTPILRIADEGSVTVRNNGQGNAGNLQINAEQILLNNRGSINAIAASGEGGNIFLQANTLLFLENNSLISSNAGGRGNGGNITIDAPIILGWENSDIIANAVQGRGGNIQITTQGILGLKYRPQLTPENDITASSQFGVSGNVQVNTIGVDPHSGLVELPANVTDSSQQIATGCSANQGSSFVATGRGGIPQNPNQQVMSDRTWSDIRDISAYRKTGEVTAQIPTPPQSLIQATGWRRNADGKIEIFADKSPTQVQPALTCAAVPKNYRN